MLKELVFESQTTYAFLEEIGRGGMGIVYLAERNSGGVTDYVVLKTLKSLNKDDEKALRQEANMAAVLRHENIVKTYGLELIPLSVLPEKFVESLGGLSYLREQQHSQSKLRRLQFRKKTSKELSQLTKNVDEEKQLMLIVMDYIDGINLRSLYYEHICQGYLIPVMFGAFIISRIARALAYAHNYLIHRDVSPENIMINTQGICKLSDFGIAVATRKQPDYWAGKLAYMAPEQIFNQAIDERIDIFSLGSVGYQMLTGIPAIQLNLNVDFDQQVAQAKQQLHQGILPPAKVRHDIPEEISDIVMKMIAFSPYKRYQRASEVANDLEKKFLYAKGYGPTNNSLACYLNMFENKFSNYNEENLEQLSFLKNSQGEIEVRRTMELKDYTPEGLSFLDDRKHSEIYKRLQIARHVQEVQSIRQEQRITYIKIKYLDNVIEACQMDRILKIGSGKDMDISLEDDKVLPHHCTLEEQQEIILKNAQADAKTKINGNLVTKDQEIRNGDKIKVGAYTLFFIKQRSMASKDSYNVSLDQDVNLQSLIDNYQDFIVSFIPNQETLTRLARLIDALLQKTDLSERKLGIIPTALVESVQLLKQGKEEQIFEIRIVKSSVRLMFTCTNLSEQGYNSFLNNFKKHRQRLAEELSQKETSGDDEEGGLEDLLAEGTRAIKEQPSAKEENVNVDLAEPEIDFPDIDTTMLAAMVIVHAFERIEFQRQKNQVDLVVYL